MTNKQKEVIEEFNCNVADMADEIIRLRRISDKDDEVITGLREQLENI